MKKSDSIIEEIHHIREDISDKFSGDISAIAEDAARRQEQSSHLIWQQAKPIQSVIRGQTTFSVSTRINTNK
ncbi:hypothetical protein D5125_17225 [Magnetovirga frankeli]|uniref:hypothetical protein n=1 Tax=Magnetovirga frankeli TaxID=947516 RepID=UPI0012940F7D|nr:hypothetical protein D5125_17225 [gamma proteobacterium SS-5]